MLFKNTLVLSTIFSCLLFTNLVSAKEQNVTIKLTKIAAIQTTERSGDEIYFSIGEYPSNATPRLTRVPLFPLHWLSSQLDKVQDVVLWQGKIADDKAVLLILSLLEQDLEPWNIDDHIGSVQVKLVNNKNRLSINWGQPHYVDQPRVLQPDPTIPKFIMFGEGGKYEATFKIDVN